MAAVRLMKEAISNAKVRTVCVTNFKADGATFRNVLSLHPVHADAGYLYSVGVQYEERPEWDVRAAAAPTHRRTRTRAVAPPHAPARGTPGPTILPATLTSPFAASPLTKLLH